ncbi:MAG: aspartate carbamoyltransferase regulatory subunit [Clostridia bacterium]|nr:aspartate carbamoyltransferase regulatory subunit [Clostridia bacterium]
MTIDSIKNGVVIDHIPAGKSMTLYRYLKLDEVDCSVALLRNVHSNKLGKKDIIKIDGELDMNWDVLGYLAPDCTVNVIRDGVIVEKRFLQLPEKLTGVIQCKNPRCITTIEQELTHIFKLTNPKKGVYRCIYCEAKA